MNRDRIKITDADFGFKSSWDHTAKIVYKDAEYSLDQYNIILKKKNILEGAKVNGICKHRDGRHSQIVDMKDKLFICKFYHKFPYEIPLHIDGIYNHDKSESGYDAVGYEQLSEEGSFDWAIQIMKLGQSVRRHSWNSDDRSFIENGVIFKASNTFSPISFSQAMWSTEQDNKIFDWELYKPLLLDAKSGYICERMDGKHVQISNMTFSGCTKYFIVGNDRYDIHGKSDKDNSINLISCEPLALEGTLTWAVQMMKLGASVSGYGAKFTFHDGKILMIDGCMYSASVENFVYQMSTDYPIGWEIYVPKTKYKVGDWVEWSVGHGITYQLIITRVSQGAVYSNDFCVPLSGITRKLKPSEIVVQISIKGTIGKGEEDDYFHLYTDNEITHIYYADIDKTTRNLVDGLLKAQEEK